MFPHDEDAVDRGPLGFAVADLMACAFGLFVLFFVWVVTFDVNLRSDLQTERAHRSAATARLSQLERALAGPLHSGLVTLTEGRIGIHGSVLFQLNSAELTKEGRTLLASLVEPLKSYLDGRDEALMVSGFTDDLQMRGVFRTYQDNWELSSQRALTVVRTLVASGFPQHALFAASFAENFPAVANDSDQNRARNRRVELSPVPRPKPVVIAARETASATARQSADTP